MADAFKIGVYADILKTFLDKLFYLLLFYCLKLSFQGIKKNPLGFWHGCKKQDIIRKSVSFSFQKYLGRDQ